MDEDAEAWKRSGKDDKGQLVRWLTGTTNSGTCRMWRGACFKPVLAEINDGDLLNEARKRGFSTTAITLTNPNKKMKSEQS